MHFYAVERHYCQQENSVHTQSKREAITIEVKRREAFVSNRLLKKKKEKKESCVITSSWKYTVKKPILLAGKGQGDRLNPHLSEVSLKLRNGFRFKF